MVAQQVAKLQYGRAARRDLDPALLKNYRQSEARLQTLREVVVPIVTFWNGLPIEVRFRPSASVSIPNHHLIDLADTWRIISSLTLDVTAEALRPSWAANRRSVAEVIASGEWLQ